MRGQCMMRRASRFPCSNCHCPLMDAVARPAMPLGLRSEREWGHVRDDAHFRTQPDVDTSGALGGDDDVLLVAALLRGVVGHAEGEPEFVELGLEVGVVDVAIDPQLAGFALDLTERADL